MAIPTLPSSVESPFNYDVFLCFRGQDTRKNFTDHLYSALVRVGIRTFRDNDELRRGENLSIELLQAIHRSKIFIVIFSKNYASSRWCLDELNVIVELKKTKGQTLLPIFYHVYPSEVRYQAGPFREAFARYEEWYQFDIEKVHRWRWALQEAVSCSGWSVDGNGYESISIKKIVEEVLRKVNPTLLDVAQHPIGLESRVHHIIDLLNLETSKVHIVGIYGMAGIGKSTLAKAVYNTIHATFEGSSFLSNLKVSSERRLSLVHLQEQLLNDILKTKVKIGNVDRGINIIEERIHRKKVLVILDDVDDFENLNMLVKKQWFGVGSRIIIITRDEHLLCQLGVDEKYKVEELNHRESLQLLSWHVFEKANPEVDYSGLSIEAVNYAGGIPSTLVVLGSFLKGRGIAEWKSELENFRRNSHVWIEKTAKNSGCSSTPVAVDASLMVQLLQRFDQLSQQLDEQKQLILEQRKYFDDQIAEVKKTVKEDVDSRTCLQMRSIVDHFNDLRSFATDHASFLKQVQTGVLAATDKITQVGQVELDVKSILQRGLPEDAGELAHEDASEIAFSFLGKRGRM